MTNYVYFNNNGNSTIGTTGIFVTAESVNGLSWSAPAPITIDGAVDQNAADADIIVLANGTFLLSYTTLGNNTGAPVSGVPIYTATSTDGINFTNAQPAFTLPSNVQVSDPSTVQLANGSFLMAVGNFGHPGTILGAGVNFYTSPNGQNYTPTGVTLTGDISPSLLLLSNGDVRLYEAGAGGIVSFISTNNGQTWTQEAGVRLALPPGSDGGLVSVVQSGPSQWLMVINELTNPSGSNNPSNFQLALATSTDGLNFTITQTGFETQAGSPDIVTDPAVAFPAGLSVSSLSAVTDTNTAYASTGHTVTVTMTTNEVVTVVGTPTLQLSDNEVATYVRGSGSNTLTFTYTVQASDNTSDLQVTGLNLPIGAVIADQSGHSLSGNVTGNLAIQINTTTVQQEIVGLYVALYATCPTGAGITYWTNATQSFDPSFMTANATTTAVSVADEAFLGQQFVQTQSTYFNSQYASLNDNNFVLALYQNLTSSSGSPAGVAYWVSLLTAAETANGNNVLSARAGLAGQFTHDVISIDLSPGAAAFGLTAAQYAALVMGQQAMFNKAAVAQYWATETGMPGGNILNFTSTTDPALAAAQHVLSGITNDPSTVTAAILGINNAVAHQNLLLV